MKLRTNKQWQKLPLISCSVPHILKSIQHDHRKNVLFEENVIMSLLCANSQTQAAEGLIVAFVGFRRS